MVKTSPSNAGGAGSIPGPEAKIPPASEHREQKRYCNKSNKDFKNDRDFPGSPVVKTSPSNAGGAGSIPGPEAKICL